MSVRHLNESCLPLKVKDSKNRLFCSTCGSRKPCASLIMIISMFIYMYIYTCCLCYRPHCILSPTGAKSTCQGKMMTVVNTTRHIFIISCCLLLKSFRSSMLNNGGGFLFSTFAQLPLEPIVNLAPSVLCGGFHILTVQCESFCLFSTNYLLISLTAQFSLIYFVGESHSLSLCLENKYAV